MQKLNFNIKIEPLKQEDIFVTKCFRDGNRISFDVMYYNDEGLFKTKRIPVQELRLKAPYALLKYY